MSTYLRFIGVIVTLAIVILCGVVLPFPGWPLWYALGVAALQITSAGALLWFIAGR